MFINNVIKGLKHRVFSSLFTIYHNVCIVSNKIIRPLPYNVTVSITSYCNFRCIGCNYGKTFMVGHELELETIQKLIDVASMRGYKNIRIYGGEPLLHKRLNKIIEYSVEKGLDPYISTNGYFLGERIGELYQSGLRFISFGFYGIEDEYDNYVKVKGAYKKVINSLETVREKFGDDVVLQMNWLFMKPTCNEWSFSKAFNIALKYKIRFKIDLIHYSLPYFNEGTNGELQFSKEDEENIKKMVKLFIEYKKKHPKIFAQTIVGLKSIPDWLLLKQEMRVPCDKYKMVWIGPNGDVKVCYVDFLLGNLYKERLEDLLHSRKHKIAVRNIIKNNCPNCHCGYDERINRYFKTFLKYKIFD